MDFKFFAVLLCAAGAMIPALGQNITIERAPGDGPVHPGKAVCILATMAHPDDEVANGNFTVQDKGAANFTTSIGSVISRQSAALVKLCGALNASAPSGNYDVVGVDLWTASGKRTHSAYPQDFHQLISFQFINDAKNVPLVTDVKRVSAQ